MRALCNRGMLLEKGRVVELGPIDRVLEEYRRRNAEAAAQIVA